MEEITAQQHGKGKAKASEAPDCQWCQDCVLKCKLGPGKFTLYKECHEAKVKCERLRDEKPERKQKRTRVEEPEAGPSGSKRPKKTSEERSDGFVELAEVLGVGLKAIMDALSKQGRQLQELVELEADKVELMQLDWWASEDEEDEEEEETEEGEEVEVEQELPELAKEKEENGEESEEAEEWNRSGIEDCHSSCT